MSRPFDYRDKSVKETLRDRSIILYTQCRIGDMHRQPSSRLQTAGGSNVASEETLYYKELLTQTFGFSEAEFEQLDAKLADLLFKFSRLHHDITITTNPKE
jgi:hypothetical protein